MAKASKATAARAGKTRRRVGPKSRDRHWLYQESVQSPDHHIRFFDRIYRRRHGRPAEWMKEDFCGTAFLSSEWVKKRPSNHAVGVDLDGPTLNWGRRNILSGMTEEQRSRLTLLQKNVLDVTEPRVDIACAFNFSYFGFKTRDMLRGYFERARKSLRPGGFLVLDMFGGWEAIMEMKDTTRHAGFTYVWEQKSFDPVNNFAKFHIHFKFHGGGGIQKAFTYDWRLWSVPEVRELLEEAGYRNVEVYWEGFDEEDGEGNGVFTRVKKAGSCPGWIAFVVASKD